MRQPTIAEHDRMIDRLTELLYDVGMSPNHFRPQDYHALTREYVSHRIRFRKDGPWNMFFADRWFREFAKGCHLK